MKITRKTVEVITIPEPGDGLNAIDVIFIDHGPGSGRLLIRCYAQSWTAWWGTMGDNTVRQFVMKADTIYVSERLLYGPGDLMRVRARKLQGDYVFRIVAALQRALKLGA